MATVGEADSLIEHFKRDPRNFRLYEGKNIWDRWLLLITGVGMVNTALHTSAILTKHSFKIALNAGVAGSFSREIPLGSVGKVECDCLTELGAESENDLLNLNDLGLFFPEQYPLSTGGKIVSQNQEEFFPERWCSLPSYSAATVNTVHGTPESINLFKQRFDAELESMEGAAFMMSCRELKIPSMQIRAVSNYVEPRNKSAWKMKLALDNLHEVLMDGIKQKKK